MRRALAGILVVVLVVIVARGADHDAARPGCHAAFGAAYSDTEMAAVANDVLGHFGDKHGQVKPADVAAARKL